MARLFGRFLLLILIVFPSTVLFTGNDYPSFVVAAQDSEDAVDGEDEETVVETDEPPATASDTVTDTPADGTVTATQDEEESEDKPLKASPNADTKLVFTKPTTTAAKLEFPAGVLVKFLVGFTNRGDKDFIVENMEASFRYPQDFTFYIQNFTALRFDRVVEPKREATFEYAFIPSEQLTARPFGLSVNLNYKDSEGNLFQDAVFNDTISIVELDEGLDGETFFLYIFLAAVAVLLLVGAQQLLTTFSKKRLSRPKQKPVEMGTQDNTGVDYSWLPQETLNTINKSPKRSPKQSPHQRRSKRRTGAGDEK